MKTINTRKFGANGDERESCFPNLFEKDQKVDNSVRNNNENR